MQLSVPPRGPDGLFDRPGEPKGGTGGNQPDAIWIYPLVQFRHKSPDRQRVTFTSARMACRAAGLRAARGLEYRQGIRQVGGAEGLNNVPDGLENRVNCAVWRAALILTVAIPRRIRMMFGDLLLPLAAIVYDTMNPPADQGKPAARPAGHTATSPAGAAAVSQADIEIRVRYAECDAMGVAHHSVYPIWLEIARTELLRRRGHCVSRPRKRGGFSLWWARLSLRYRAPARYDDLLHVDVKVLPCHGVKVEHEYQVRRDQEVLCTAQSTLVCVDRQGKLQPVPAGIAP